MARTGRIRRTVRWFALSVSVVIVGLGAMAFTKSPSHERNWHAMYERLSDVAIDGDRIAVRNLRNFSYAGAHEVAEARWEAREYDLSQLRDIWFGVSHFHDLGLAHTFLSFEFSDGRYLALSIEARLEANENYHPVTGLMRNYELSYVLADERDIVGLRTHWRNEAVYLYKLNLERDRVRRLFLDFMADVSDVAARPKFYNTLLDNCTRGLLRHSDLLPWWRHWFDYRLYLPGHADALAYDMNVIAQDAPLETIRVRARVHADGLSLDDPEFSAQVRLGS